MYHHIEKCTGTPMLENCAGSPLLTNCSIILKNVPVPPCPILLQLWSTVRSIPRFEILFGCSSLAETFINKVQQIKQKKINYNLRRELPIKPYRGAYVVHLIRPKNMVNEKSSTQKYGCKFYLFYSSTHSVQCRKSKK